MPDETLLSLQDSPRGLRCSVFRDGVIELSDQSTGQTWRTWPVAIQEDGEIDIGHVWLRTGRSLCEQYPGRFRAVESRPEGERKGVAWFELLGREGRVVGRFRATYTLEGGALEVSVDQISESIPSLSYPASFVGADELILPLGPGRRYTAPEGAGGDLRFFIFWGHLGMRMWGMVRGQDHGLLADFHSGHADAGLHLTKMFAAPGYLKSLGTWGDTPRSIRYRFTRGGYVGLAKAYREVARQRGLLVSLKEKAAQRPALTNLLTGRHVSFMLGRTLHPEKAAERLESPERLDATNPGTVVQADITYSVVDQALRELQSAGMTHGLSVVRGWIRGGYDETHPDILPPEEAFGPASRLADLCKLRSGISVALHDNYQDIYLQSPSWPKGVIRLRNGDPMPGGYWAGGQAYILNARDSLAYLHRNWPGISELGPRAYFIDTTTAVQLYQSFEPGNTCTRTQDEQYKLEQLRFLTQQGIAAGSEESSEFALPFVDWLETRHQRQPLSTPPIWGLVFHDCVATGRYGNAWLNGSGSAQWAGSADAGLAARSSPAQAAPGWATEMLWGYYILMGVSNWKQERDTMLTAMRNTRHVDQHFARIATAELLNHRYLTPDGHVEQTHWSTGQAVTVNFAPTPVRVEGLELQPGEVRVSD